MANFPSSVSTNANLYIAVNGLQTTLASNILSTDTTIALTSTTGFPTTGLVTIENNEVVSYTGISGANLTGCTRGADGTTALAHNTGVTVGATIVAAHHNLLKDEIIAIETALGASFAKGNLTAGSSKISVTGGTGAVIGSGATVDIGTFNLGQLSNVVLTSPTTNDLLQFNGTNWVNYPSSVLATANTAMLRDSNANVKVNTLIENFTTTATAAVTTVLTVSTAPIQQFTGTTTQTVTLPDATTLAVGYQITILNRSTGIVTVNNNGGSLQQSMAPSTQTTFTCTNIGSANGTWDVSTSSGAGGSTAYREDYVVGTALNNYTGSTTVFNLVNTYTTGNHTLIVTVDGDVQTLGSTIDYQETNTSTVTFNNALVTGQKVSFLFQTPTSSGGTVNTGTANQVAYYPTSTTQVSPTSAFVVGSNGPNGIVTGTNTNDNAAAGVVGQYISSTVALGAAISATNLTFVNITSISLPAGDWDVTGQPIYSANSGTGLGRFSGAVSAFSGNTTTDHIVGDNELHSLEVSTQDVPVTIAAWRVSLASTTTIYLKGNATFSGGTVQLYGRISARRVR